LPALPGCRENRDNKAVKKKFEECDFDKEKKFKQESTLLLKKRVDCDYNQ